MTKAKWIIGLGVTLLWSGAALAAPTPQEKCDGARVKAWRTYSSCAHNVVAKIAGGILVDVTPIHDAFAKCRHKYFSRWDNLQGAPYAGSTCIGSRFTDNGDGTVTDNLSELTWEMKTDDSTVHDKDNTYSWSLGSNLEDGTAFTSFLDTVNAGFGGANGWRLATLTELQTILLDYPCTAASCVCSSAPCVDPALDAATTGSLFYWSATSYLYLPTSAWGVHFASGLVIPNAKTTTSYGRAVRGGL